MNIWQTEKFSENHPSNISVYSKLLSNLYDQSWYSQLIEDEIQFFLSFVQQKRVLEIGSGTGRISIPLLKSGCDLYGIEGSSEMYVVLQSKLDVSQHSRFILWDARKTPYPVESEQFETILIPFSTFGLIHNQVENLGDNMLFHEFHRVLKSQGILIINDYRVNTFQEEFGNNLNCVQVFHHTHQEYGKIQEIQESQFQEVPHRLLPHQMIRKRRTYFIRESDGVLLEEHFERVPLWYPDDYKVLGRDAGFEYLRGERCEFHDAPSIIHIFQKKKRKP